MFKLFRKKNINEQINNELIISPISVCYSGFKANVNGKEIEFTINPSSTNSFQVFIISFDNKKIHSFVYLEGYGDTIENSLRRAIIKYVKESKDFINKLGL